MTREEFIEKYDFQEICSEDKALTYMIGALLALPSKTEEVKTFKKIGIERLKRSLCKLNEDFEEMINDLVSIEEADNDR